MKIQVEKSPPFWSCLIFDGVMIMRPNDTTERMNGTSESNKIRLLYISTASWFQPSNCMKNESYACKKAQLFWSMTIQQIIVIGMLTRIFRNSYMGSSNYQSKQCTIIGQFPQNYNSFATSQNKRKHITQLTSPETNMSSWKKHHEWRCLHLLHQKWGFSSQPC